MLNKKRKNKGSILIEAIVASTLFIIISGAILGTLLDTRRNQYNAYLYNKGGQLLQEGMEAMLSIKNVGWESGSWNNQNCFDSFTAGTHYLEKDADDNWELTSSAYLINDVFDRVITIEDVKRLDDGKGDIDATGTGESLLPSGEVTKKVTITITWLDWMQNN